MAFLGEFAHRRVSAQISKKCVRHRWRIMSFSGHSRLAPRTQVDGAHHHAEHVGRNEAQLVGFETDDADQYAVDAGQRPPFPTPSPYQNGGRNGQYAGQVIETKHG